jgi:hypothetical protein
VTASDVPLASRANAVTRHGVTNVRSLPAAEACRSEAAFTFILNGG